MRVLDTQVIPLADVVIDAAIAWRDSQYPAFAALATEQGAAVPALAAFSGLAGYEVQP